MKQTFIADTANVTFRRKKDGHVVFTAEAQLAGLSGSEESEVIRGGIGNKALYTIKHSKEVNLSVRNATFNLEYLAMSQGVSIEQGTAQVTVVERGLEIENGVVTLKDLPLEGTVRYQVGGGEFKEVDSVSGKEATISNASDGDKVTVEYKKEVEGRRIVLDATKFAENYEVQYETIEYDTQTNEVIKDIYFLFHNCTPAGDYEINLENGEAYTPELEFTAMAKENSDEIGEIIEVDRNPEDTGAGTP